MMHADTILTAEQEKFLREAAAYLEQPRLLIRLANLVGKPADLLVRFLPASAQETVGRATQTALRQGIDWAAWSVPRPNASAEAARQRPWLGAPRRLWDKHGHTAVAAGAGAVGGFFGLAGLAGELPASTLIMLRSIAKIASDQGMDLTQPAARLECLSVFSLGSPALAEMDSTYFATRLGLAVAVQDAAAVLARQGAVSLAESLTQGSAPLLARLIQQIAQRFQVVVSQKMAAQAVPLAGAATGALINAAFTDHFNTVARYHFGILRLEERYGADAVRLAYHPAVATPALALHDGSSQRLPPI